MRHSLPLGRSPSRHTGTSGEGPTLPYQALVMRESVKLLAGFAPCSRKTFSLQLGVEGQQLVEDVVALAQAGMAKDLAAGDHVEGDAAETAADLDVAPARVLAGGAP